MFFLLLASGFKRFYSLDLGDFQFLLGINNIYGHGYPQWEISTCFFSIFVLPSTGIFTMKEQAMGHKHSVPSITFYSKEQRIESVELRHKFTLPLMKKRAGISFPLLIKYWSELHGSFFVSPIIPNQLATWRRSGILKQL